MIFAGLVMALAIIITYIDFKKQFHEIVKNKYGNTQFILEHFDKDYIEYLKDGKFPEKTFLTNQERDAFNCLINSTQTDTEFLETLPRLYLIIGLIFSYSLFFSGWKSLKTKQILKELRKDNANLKEDI